MQRGVTAATRIRRASAERHREQGALVPAHSGPAELELIISVLTVD